VSAADVVQEPEAPQAEPDAAEPEQRTVGAELVPAPPEQAAAVQAAPTARAPELVLMKRQAEMLAESDIIPVAYQGKPANVLVAAMTGRNYGWDVLTAMRNGHVIEGVWTLRPEAMLALVRRAGHKVSGSTSSDRAEITGTRADDGTSITIVWSMADAKRAGLDQKTNWKKWPAAMLWARAAAQLCRMLFADVLLGISYTPEELGADVNEQGEVIDVNEAVPGLATDERWVNKERAQAEQQAQQRQAQQDSPADGTELWDLQVLIQALPEQARHQLRLQWMADGSRVRGYKPHVLPGRLLRAGRAMVNAHWAQQVAAGVDKANAVAYVQGLVAGRLTQLLVPTIPETDAQAPQDSPEPEPGPDVPAEPSESQEDDPGPPSDDASPEPDAVDWRPVLRDLAADVRQAASGMPEPVITSIADRVKGMHHTVVNRWLAWAGSDAEFPPESPIDLRRMAVSAVWMLWWRENSGQLPESDTPPEPEQEGAEQ
jgi:hypothetical protein